MLRYNNETFEMNGTDGKPCKVRQTTKQGARKAYEDGKDIWLFPCLMAIGNPWQSPYSTSKEKTEGNAWTERSTFDDIVNDFAYYNCDNERGRYPIFFIPAA